MEEKKIPHTITAEHNNGGGNVKIVVSDNVAMSIFSNPLLAYKLFKANKTPNVKFIKPDRIITVYPGKDWKQVMETICKQLKKAGGKYKHGK